MLAWTSSSRAGRKQCKSGCLTLAGSRVLSFVYTGYVWFVPTHLFRRCSSISRFCEFQCGVRQFYRAAEKDHLSCQRRGDVPVIDWWLSPSCLRQSCKKFAVLLLNLENWRSRRDHVCSQSDSYGVVPLWSTKIEWPSGCRFSSGIRYCATPERDRIRYAGFTLLVCVWL